MYAGMYSALKRCNVLANESRLVRRVFVGIRRHVCSRYQQSSSISYGSDQTWRHSRTWLRVCWELNLSSLNLLVLAEYGYETFQYEDKNAWTLPLQKVAGMENARYLVAVPKSCERDPTEWPVVALLLLLLLLLFIPIQRYTSYNVLFVWGITNCSTAQALTLFDSESMHIESLQLRKLCT